MAHETIARPLVVDPWPSDPIEVSLEATAEQCKMLAKRFGLVIVDRLTGHARIDRCDGGRAIRLRGRLQADVVQTCVVSLEDVPAAIDETFECRFTRPGAALPADDGEQDIEALDGAELDVGEVFAQQLSLALDPYPRAADAYALASRELGPNIAFGQDAPKDAPTVAMVDWGGSAVPTKRGG